jgi:hypothetical protein
MTFTLYSVDLIRLSCSVGSLRPLKADKLNFVRAFFMCVLKKNIKTGQNSRVFN